MNSVFALEISVCVETFNGYGCALKSRFFAVKPVDKLYRKFVALCPTGYHSVKHLCPVLSLCSARTGVEGDDGVVLVVFARQKHLNAFLFLCRDDLGKFVLNLGNRILVVFLDSHFGENYGVLKLSAKCVVVCDGVLVLFDGLENL